MTDLYAPKRARAQRIAKLWSTGTITLTRSTLGTSAPTTPWIPGTPTLNVYTLDARADGVAAEYVNGETILATDLMVIASPKARHTLSDGDPADGAIVDIVPGMTDLLTIDGARKVIKKIEAVPASGPPGLFHIVVAS